MRYILSILCITLCSAFCWAQGDDFNERMLQQSRELFEREDYDSALFFINKATLTKGKVQQNPDLAAEIHEQYSLIFSALNDKQQSDYHRNMYLDIKEQARRDLHLEKEAERLQRIVETQSEKIAVTFLVIIIVLIITIYFYLRFSHREDTEEQILDKKTYDEMAEELSEQIAILQHSITTNKEQNIDKHTKVFLINSITPLIERMRNEMEKYQTDKKENRIEYIREILAQIQDYNNLLTEWIRMEQGHLSFRAETFPLEELFALMRKNQKTFAMKGITLEVEEPEECSGKTGRCMIKADKTLTLFMLNTLADNARKATPQGGKVSVKATSTDDFVEISITDTGKGMSEEELAQVFSHSIQNGHGFGLLNCRGIINSYKKAGNIFSCCMMDAESTPGKGSRFFFRLPKAVAKCIALLVLLAAAQTATAKQTAAAGQTTTLPEQAYAQEKPSRYSEKIHDPHLRRAADYADSAFYSNLAGDYEQTIHFADSVQLYITDHIMHCETVDSLLMGDILVDICNEAAVASLALHRWEDYQTYNNTYEQYFDKITNSKELEEVCQQKETQIEYLLWMKWLCNVFAVIAAIAAVIVIAGKYLKRRRMLRLAEQLDIAGKKSLVAKLAYENDQLHIANNIIANGLSTIKHETLYFPARIEQLLSTDGALEMISYYRELHIQLSSVFMQKNLNTGLRIEKINLQELCGADIDIRAGKDLIDIRADKDLFQYMLRLIKKQLKVSRLDISVEDRQQYADLIIRAQSPLPASQAEAFAPRIGNTVFLVCRQIIREMSGHDARSCGININNEQNTIIITLRKL